jgi:putative ABC transport system substrate-binding protein
VLGLRQGLRELGYTEGQDVLLEIRSGSGRPEAARVAADELVTAQVQVLVSAGTVATQAARDATDALPIVFTQVGDPVGAGFVQSLARPGGNLTGFSHLLPATSGKRLELLREMVPAVRRVLTIYDPANPSSAAAAEVARTSAEPLGVQLRERHIKSRDEVLTALGEIDRGRIDALLVLPDSLVVNAGEQILETSVKARLPVMFHEDTWVRRGGLASYGASFTELGRQAATYVDKILHGTNPSDLPMQQASTFDLVINLKTARSLGLVVPPSVLRQATEVIE